MQLLVHLSTHLSHIVLIGVGHLPKACKGACSRSQRRPVTYEAFNLSSLVSSHLHFPRYRHKEKPLLRHVRKGLS